MNRLLIAGATALLLGAPAAQALDWHLEQDLADLLVEVKVLDVNLDDDRGLESGAIAVMVTNHEAQVIVCKLTPGATEVSPDMRQSFLHRILPDERSVLEMAGTFGDEQLDARLVCRPEDAPFF